MKVILSIITGAALVMGVRAQTQCDSVASAIPTCGVPCILSAASAVGCTDSADYSCRCANADAIQAGAINCVLSSCPNIQDALSVSAQAKSVCSCVATATPPSSTPPSSTPPTASSSPTPPSSPPPSSQPPVTSPTRPSSSKPSSTPSSPPGGEKTTVTVTLQTTVTITTPTTVTSQVTKTVTTCTSTPPPAPSCPGGGSDPCAKMKGFEKILCVLGKIIAGSGSGGQGGSRRARRALGSE